ncbi:hypothetical protein EKO23_03610 [Nocardioides guangzhouensis]|uniref:Sulfotransferase family protein n=1 Tax=Nocardioides guangzhouensis TaxID=2497878 RepID=A0A4Q4ZJF7_9ACTN|nr:hypothetical protein [Nocardioides guangzhouensis]RYP88423.1 hypothetical protein EKO23_03610 [Nocardioides guangzhouensis]
MPSRVFAHIGLPKTGTTYLQALLYANRDAFARQGVTVIGRHRLHYDAASEISGAKSKRTGRVPTDRWAKVVKLVEAAPTRGAVLSSERYSLVARREDVAAFVESLAGADVHLVVTVRDLVAAEPSAWQEYVKNGGTRSWPDFCAHGVADPYRLQQRRRIRRVLTIWPPVVPPERIHVVTVPPPGGPRERLFERFCSVLGVDPRAMDTLEAERRNTSLDFVATEMLRRVNAREPELPVPVQRGEIKRFLADGELSRRSSTIRPALEGEALALARAENDWLVETLSTGGFHVVGDLADLHGEHPDAPASYDVPAEDLLDAALEAVTLLARRSYERGVVVRQAARELRASRESAGEA